MKLLLITLTLFSLNLYAKVPSEIERFIDKKGTHSEGGRCTVRVSGDDVLEIETNGYDYILSADLKDARKIDDGKGTVIFKIQENENDLQGPNECGNLKMVSHKRTVEVKGKVLTIKSNIRCFLFSYLDLESSCRIK